MTCVAETMTIASLPLDKIDPDPEQPRKIFDACELSALAASIEKNGLLQPIEVRPNGDRYIIVFGERRFRAHQINRATHIKAQVVSSECGPSIRVRQLIENSQRQNISPLEEADSYRSLLDATGWSVEALAKNLGILQPWRITERLSLLSLRPEYQALLKASQITHSQATEMSRHAGPAQDMLFRLIRSGSCNTYAALRNASECLLAATSQSALFTPQDPPTPSEMRLAKSFEDKINSVASMLRAGIAENQVTAIKKVNPSRAATIADTLAAMQTDLRRLENALRAVSIQHSLTLDGIN